MVQSNQNNNNSVNPNNNNNGNGNGNGNNNNNNPNGQNNLPQTVQIGQTQVPVFPITLTANQILGLAQQYPHLTQSFVPYVIDNNGQIT